MKSPRHVYHVDSFTREKFRGNPAGVVTQADGLTDDVMQDIARELKHSETAFIFSSNGPDHDVHVRFFTPTMEVPICGHATVAAHYVKAVEDKVQGTRRLIQKTGAGNLPVDVTQDGDDYKVLMTQGKIEFGNRIEGNKREILISALGLSERDLDVRCPIQIVSTGHSKVMIGIKNRAVLNNLSPDMPSLVKLSQVIGCNGYFVFTLDSNNPQILTHGRMFAPAIGIHEDPVTGNANGPLGAYLAHYRLAEHDGAQLKFRSQQGEAIRRTGTVEVIVDIEENQPKVVRIGGEAVIILKSELTL